MEGLDLKFEVMGALCAMQVFVVNGIEADYGDFGEKYDDHPSIAEDYGCGNMKFFPGEISEELLNKYSITREQATHIQGKLEEALSFGQCGWCI